MNPIKSSCIFCRDNVPHERHVTLVEHARLFGEAENYGQRMVLDKPASDVVVASSAKQRVA